MKTIGTVLRDYRQKHHLSANELSRRTMVPTDFIDALEEEDLARLPAPSLVKGYVRLIAQEIGLPEENALALFRRDLDRTPAANPVAPHRRRGWRFWLTPRILSLAVLWLAILVGGFWLFQKWRHLGRPPQLEVSSPAQAAIVAAPISVTGQTEPDASLTINTELVSLDPQGKFNYSLDLPPGERAIVVQSRDRQGRASEQIIFVTVE
jgi:cytoskeletal protein RodZ